MPKIFKLMVFCLIILCVNSCALLSGNDDGYKFDYEHDPDTGETEPDVAAMNENIIVTEPMTVLQEPEPETQLEIEPEISIDPQVSPLGNVFSASGTIKSDTDQLIKLHIDWEAHQIGESEYVSLDVIVYIDCYAITVGERTNSTLTVDGEKVEFSTPILTNENNSLTSIELHRKNVQIHNPEGDELKSVDVEAAYYFGGSYGGESIGWVEVGGTIYLTNDESLIPKRDVNETIETPETTQTIETPEITETEKNFLTPELPEDPFEPVEG